MKGGKQGRKRRSSSGGAKDKGLRSGVKKGGATRPSNAPPGKRGKEKQFGGFRTSGDE